MILVQVTGMTRLLNTLKTAPEILRLAEMEAMKASVLTVEAAAKARVPRRTGRLFSSIESRVEMLGNGVEGRVATNVDYAPAVEMGAVAHEIAPVQAQALRFEIGGRAVFARRVHHPGNKPRPFMRPALEESLITIRELFLQAAGRMATHISRG